jgi:ABC-type multidrug transport system ATPase subunit
MNLLTGLYSATAGTAIINGYDLNTDIDQIRESMGFVPQHNVLFDGMSVINHLYFYARLKNRSASDTKTEIERLLIDTGLENKRNEMAKTLSGGMQRKLSVAIAFVGGSKIVILDEPSSGILFKILIRKILNG